MNKDTKMNCFIYCRRSTEDKDRQALSLDDQEKVCQELANEKGLDVLHIFKESHSAKRPGKRPMFDEMLKRLASKETSTIITWKADRLARNAKEGGALIDLVDYELLKITTPTVDYDTNNSTFLFIEFGMSTKYSKDLSENVKRGLKTKIEQGWSPGNCPLGYINNKFKQQGLKDISPDPLRFDLCRKWWEMMLTGNYTVTSSLVKITEMGLLSKTNKPISMTQSHRFFRNIYYTGLFDWKGIRYKGSQKPMVSMSEFIKVQDILNKTSHQRKTRNNYFFMKVLRCGECGSVITCDKQVRSFKSGKIIVYPYARCKKNKGIDCKQDYVKADEIEKQTMELLKNIEITPAYASWIRAMLKMRNEKEFEFEKQQKTRATVWLSKILDEKKNLYGMKIDGIISEEQYQNEKSRLLVEEKKLEESQKTSNIVSWTRTMEDILDISQNMSKIFDKVSEDSKRLLLRMVGSNLILKDKKVRIQAKNLFIHLKNTEKLVFNEIVLVEPNKRPKDRLYQDYSAKNLHMERDKIYWSKLSKYITPRFVYQLQEFKDSAGVENLNYKQ